MRSDRVWLHNNVDFSPLGVFAAVIKPWQSFCGHLRMVVKQMLSLAPTLGFGAGVRIKALCVADLRYYCIIGKLP